MIRAGLETKTAVLLESLARIAPSEEIAALFELEKSSELFWHTIGRSGGPDLESDTLNSATTMGDIWNYKDKG